MACFLSQFFAENVVFSSFLVTETRIAYRTVDAYLTERYTTKHTIFIARALNY